MHINKLKPAPDNPRHNNSAVDKIARSIKLHGFAAPIVANFQNEILAGHTRWKAMQKLNQEEPGKFSMVPVRQIDLTGKQAQLYRIADNKLGELASWNEAMLEEQLKDLMVDFEDELMDMEFSDDKLFEVMNENTLEKEIIPNIKEEVKSLFGEVYELGNNRLMCGDCRSEDDVKKLFKNEKINMAFTSPPYSSQRTYDESTFEPIKPEKYVSWFELVQKNVKKHLSDNGSWFVNIKEHCTNGERSLYVKDLTIAHVRKWKWKFVDEFCWQRVGLPGRFPNRFKNGFEPIFHFSKNSKIKFRPDNVAYNFDSSNSLTYDMAKYLGRQSGYTKEGSNGGPGSVRSKNRSGALPSNVINISGVEKNINHSAMFPTKLPEFFIKAYSDINDIIYDPFLGSGTTLIASANKKRICYGMEISPAYCDLIRKRWTNWAVKNNIEPGSGALFDD